MKKYEVTEEIKAIGSTILHRIRGLRDFGDVKAGDIGGWIESEKNLSHGGNAWVYDNARVWGDAQVCDNAEVRGNVKVCGNAKVCGAHDWIAVNNIGSRDDTTTFYRNKDKGISVSCECFFRHPRRICESRERNARG